MHTLQSNSINIKVANKGAELQSIYHKANALEYMWSAGVAWPKKSPVLFPIVGGLKNNTYNYKGKQYTLPRHGFARDMTFDLVSQTQNTLLFKLGDNENTQQIYPFSFCFFVQYTLHNNTVEIKYIVENKGEEEMFFSVGAHPAFAVPLVQGTTYKDYYLEFSERENALRWPLTAEGLIQSEPQPFLNNVNILPLKRELFLEDAIVFKDLKSKEISLLSDVTNRGLQVHFNGFDYVGIWAAKNADFVCIEPWCGIADSANATGNLQEKEGINLLESGKVFERSFTIEVF